MKIFLFLTIAMAFLASSLNAQPWTQLPTVPSSQSLLSIHFLDDYTGYVVGAGGTILKTTDGGATWASQTSNSGEALYSTFFNDALKGWAVGDNNTILTTLDGGTNWTIVSVPGVSAHFRVVWFLNANIGFIAGGISFTSSTILKTTNGGLTWTNISPTGSCQGQGIYGIFFTDANTGFASDFDGKILKTTTGGTGVTPWSCATISANDNLHGIYFLDANNGYVVGGNTGTNTGVIFKTTDAGASWNLVAPFYAPGSFLTDIKFFGDTGFATGGNVLNNSNGVIYKTTHNPTMPTTNIWTPETTAPLIVARQYRLFLPCSHTGFSCGLNGSILKVTGLNDDCCDEFHDSFANTILVAQATATSGTYTFPEPSGTLPGDILSWDFGDGSLVAVGNSPFAPVHHYNQPGSYLATLYIERILPNDDTCKIKLCQLVEVPVTCEDCIQFIQQANVHLAVDLSAWSPTTGPVTFTPLPSFAPHNVRINWDFDCDGVTDQTTTGNAPASFNFPCGQQSVCYTVECLLSQQVACFSQDTAQVFNIPCPGNQGDCPNLVTNGEFNLGADGSFTTLPTNSNCTDAGTGTSWVANDFVVKCAGWTPSGDHTTGTGNFLIIDGVPNGTGPFIVWQTSSLVTANSNTTYEFSFWVKTAFAQPAFNLQMAVVAGSTTFTSQLCQSTPTWTKYSFIWFNNSPIPTFVNLQIRQMTAGGTRDFGIDDINFSCIGCCDFTTDAMDFGIVGTGQGGNNYQFCLSPNISPIDIIEWDLDCDGVPDTPASTSGNCATFPLTPANSEICVTVFHITGDDTCRVKLNACLPEITADTCSCDDFQSDVAAGFVWNENPPGTVNFTPNSLTACDNIIWHWGDNITSTSTGNASISHTYSAPGSYDVCMFVTRTLPDGTVCASSEYCFTIMTTVAISEVVLLAPSMTVKPNPSAGDVTVSLPGSYDYDNSFLRLNTVAGQVVQVIPFESAEMQLNLDPLPAGLYFLSLVDEQGKLLLKPVKLVKQ